MNVEYDVEQILFDPSGSGNYASCVRIDVCKDGHILNIGNHKLTQYNEKNFCKEKILDQGSVSGLVIEIAEDEYSDQTCMIKLKFKNNEKYIIKFPCNEKSRYKNFLGKDVKLEYLVWQKWNENNRKKICKRKDVLKSIKIIE